MLQGYCKAGRAEVVERDRFATPNSLKSHGERNLLSPVSNTCAITQSCACLRGQYTLRKITRHSNHVPRLNLHAPAAPPVPHLPRFRALALFGRRPPQRVDSIVMPASKNLHNKSARLVGLIASRRSAIVPLHYGRGALADGLLRSSPPGGPAFGCRRGIHALRRPACENLLSGRAFKGASDGLVGRSSRSQLTRVRGRARPSTGPAGAQGERHVRHLERLAIAKLRVLVGQVGDRVHDGDCLRGFHRGDDAGRPCPCPQPLAVEHDRVRPAAVLDRAEALVGGQHLGFLSTPEETTSAASSRTR